MAHLEPSAEALAQETAEQLSGATRLQSYKAIYYGKDNAVVDGKEDPHAVFFQSLVTNQQPQPTFEFRFQVFRYEDTDKYGYGPEVFVWRYWLAPREEEPQDVVPLFDVVKVSVNGVDLENIRKKGDGDANGVTFVAVYKPVKDREYVIETELRLPPPKEASYVHIEPRALCKGVSITCDVIDSEFDAVAVETLRAHNVRIDRTPSDVERRTLITSVSTPGWVLPTAGVAFVFYKPTKPYNQPST